MSDNSGGSISKFNAGVAQTERIDGLQKAMNAARYNLTAFNMETGTFNYEAAKNSLDGAFLEAWGKLSDDEKLEGETIKNLIESTLKYFPVMELKVVQRAKGPSYQINEDNLEKLKKLLFIYEKKVREYLDKHNLNAPSKDEDDEGW